MPFNPEDLSLRAVARNKFEAIDRGDITLPGFLRPCRLKILMVIDGFPGSFLNVSFSDSYFGLATVLDTLRTNPEWWVKFNVTRAHRQTDSFKPDPATEPVLHARYGPHFENFRFTQGGFNLNDYDQVWLFGARGNPNDGDRLTDAELEILARWMDERQGGLFATGDHADLGASLCARVPRARSMRRWTSSNVPGVIPKPVTSPSGSGRHDTLLKGEDVFYTFNDESDIHPMHTTVKKYPLVSWSRLFHRSAPHPILCGANGVIDILPDHPHEGWVNDTADIAPGLTFSFGAYVNKPEYPSVAGNQPLPEVIAWAHVQGDHTEGRFGNPGTDRNKGPANAKTFGAIGAYDGHGVNVGRVAVDSTWHHWFDVNLTGRPTEPGLDQVDPVTAMDPKAQGFTYNAIGQQAFERIQNYYRNMAIWLAAPAKQNCIFLRATSGAVIRYPLAEQLDINLPIWELGGFARDAIGRRAGQCTITEWIWRFFPIEVQEIFKPKPDPCLTCPPFEMIELFALGGIVREMLTLAYNNPRGMDKLEETHWANALAKGIEQGLGEFAERYQKSLRQTEASMKLFSAVFKNLPKADVFLAKEKESAKPRKAKAVAKTGSIKKKKK